MTLQQIAGLGIILCVLLAAAAAAYLPIALRLDARDAHMAHLPGDCIECDGPA